MMVESRDARAPMRALGDLGCEEPCRGSLRPRRGDPATSLTSTRTPTTRNIGEPQQPGSASRRHHAPYRAHDDLNSNFESRARSSLSP